jgi:hypothetical protein
MDNVLLVVPAADVNVVDPGKGCMAVPDGPPYVAEKMALQFSG